MAFTEITVALDELAAYEAYTKGEHWNGWECPYFTREVAEQVLTELEREWVFNTETDSFEALPVGLIDDETDAYQYQGITAVIDGTETRLYPIGAYSWCWYSVSE